VNVNVPWWVLVLLIVLGWGMRTVWEIIRARSQPAVIAHREARRLTEKHRKAHRYEEWTSLQFNGLKFEWAWEGLAVSSLRAICPKCLRDASLPPDSEEDQRYTCRPCGHQAGPFRGQWQIREEIVRQARSRWPDKQFSTENLDAREWYQF
jgi:hypothetical protein